MKTSLGEIVEMSKRFNVSPFKVAYIINVADKTVPSIGYDIFF